MRLFDSQGHGQSENRTMAERLAEWKRSGSKVPFNFSAVAEASKAVAKPRKARLSVKGN